MLTLGSNQGLEVKDVNAKHIPPQSEAPFLLINRGFLRKVCYQLKAVKTGVLGGYNCCLETWVRDKSWVSTREVLNPTLWTKTLRQGAKMLD